jgi:hypothetical protein
VAGSLALGAYIPFEMLAGSLPFYLRANAKIGKWRHLNHECTQSDFIFSFRAIF